MLTGQVAHDIQYKNVLNGTSAFVTKIYIYIPVVLLSLPPTHALSSFHLLLYSHSPRGAPYCGPGRSALFVSSVIG